MLSEVLLSTLGLEETQVARLSVAWENDTASVARPEGESGNRPGEMTSAPGSVESPESLPAGQESIVENSEGEDEEA